MRDCQQPSHFLLRLGVVAGFVLVLLLALLPGQAPGLSLAAPDAGTTCITLQPAASVGKDAYIKEDKQDERRGGDSDLRVKTESGKLNRALLQFDLSGIPSTALITSATLSLYVTDVKDGNVTIHAHGITNSWTESEVTWKARNKATSTLWTALGGDYGSSVASTAFVKDVKNYWATWNLTSLASAWKTTPATNYGVLLQSPVTNPKNETKFKSSDDGASSLRPKLQVCYNDAVILSPDNSGEGVAGQTHTYGHTITVGGLTTVVNLSASSSQGWTTRIYADNSPQNGVKDNNTIIAATPSIGPSADYGIVVEVDIPSGAVPGAVDVTTVTAIAVNGGKSDTATDTTTVGRLLRVAPDYNQYAVAGAVLFYGHTVTNNGGSQDCVTVTATSTQGWTVKLWEDTNKNGLHETSSPNEPLLSNPVCIAPGVSYYLVAEVQVPGGANVGTVDVTTVKATSGNEPSKSDSATDRTEVFVNTPPVVDGKYDDIYKISPDATEVCYVANGVLFGRLASFYQQGSGSVYMVLAIDKDFVDNTYGTNAIGWSGGHTFGNLTGSDRAFFKAYDANDALKLDFEIDFISSGGTGSSGYASLGLGGDGGLNVNNSGLSSTNIVQASASSLEYSLNQYCTGGTGGNCSASGNLFTNSPGTDSFYTPNPTYPNWIYDTIYEVKINAAAFGAAGFGSIDVPQIHASPSKTGNNTVVAEPGVCPGEIGDFVWNDLNVDGVQDGGGETGIDGVQLKLYQDDGDGLFNANSDTAYGTQTTSAGGKYLFQNLPPNDYFVDVVNATVPAGKVLTTNNDPTPKISLGAGQKYLQADFGYADAFSRLSIDKSASESVALGDRITYTIRITNTGVLEINFVPLEDFYDPAKLQFVSATPTQTSFSGGVIKWTDLTANAPTGFGVDLAPGQSFVVTVVFNTLVATKSADKAETIAVDPVVDGRLDSNYIFVKKTTTPGSDAPGNLYRYNGASICYYAFVVDRSFNDNVYADSDTAYMSLDGWTSSHPFSKLRDSDNAEFTISYTGGSFSALTLDYLKAVSTGVWDSGQTGGDGSKAPGTAPINAAMTSLHWNLLNSGWSDLTHSPAYNYNNVSGNYWEWAMIYEFSIPKSQMNNSCGTVDLGSAHNSNSKDNSSLGKIGDYVWHDADAQGDQDEVNAGFPNVIVNLRQSTSTGTIVRTTHTEPGTTGYYIFNNLASGTYWVDVDETTLPTGASLTTPPEPRQIVIGTGGINLTADFGYVLGQGTIGDRVYYDINNDGGLDNDGEPGINGVKVNLFQGSCPGSGSPFRSLWTAGNGGYLFTNLSAGNYCVNVDESTLPANLALTTANEPRPATLATSTSNYLLADFGYRALCPDGTPNLVQVGAAIDQNGDPVSPVADDACVIIANAKYSISKVLNGSNPVRNGEPISFTIRITNTGTLPLTTVPLVDTYDTAYLTYVGSTPMSEDQINDGTINWGDLTQSGTKGFNADLAPGQSFGVIVHFVGRADTTGLPAQPPCTRAGYTCNVVTVSGVKYDPDGPGGVGEQGPLSPKSAWADVQIVVPTGVDVMNATASGEAYGVSLGWQTQNETNLIGFNVVRVDGDGRQVLNSELIPAQASGQPAGSSYGFIDSAVLPGTSYDYLLEIVRTDSEPTELSLGSVTAKWYLFMSQVSR
ncbi:MAG: MSCRAMM family adhesin SdrC [Caldilineaceae bacterium]|nr:MSCRAMM family adhesin SdrC [Caldilineaceae bacterium]